MPYKDRADLYQAQKRHRIKIRDKLCEFLSKRCCVDCGENDFRVLDFDHTERNKKFKSVSDMRSGHYSWIKIESEIMKCEIRCANCHRKKTYVQLGGGK